MVRSKCRHAPTDHKIHDQGKLRELLKYEAEVKQIEQGRRHLLRLAK